MNARRISERFPAAVSGSVRARRDLASASALSLVVAIAFFSAGSAHAASAFGPPPGGPDLSSMAFDASDFTSARVLRQGYVRPDRDDGFIAEYDREFRALSVKLGRKRLVSLENDVALARTVDDASLLVDAFTLGVLLGSGEVRKGLAKQFNVKPNAVRIGLPTKPRAGDQSVALRIRIATSAGELNLLIAVVRVGRVDSVFYLAGLPRVHIADAETRLLARLAARHIRSGLAPANTSLPLVSGIPQASQFLTAAPGTWSNAPTAFAYKWQRCDATGTTCTDAGAPGQAYSVTSADVGQTLRVAVTATNKYGSATALSAQTQVVSAAGSPINTSPPVISGTAAVGQTLTASTGSWSGNPTTYAYEWQRCTSTGTSCADIADSTSQAYIVSSSDSGSTLRVVVTATNALGAASAASAVTAVVP